MAMESWNDYRASKEPKGDKASSISDDMRLMHRSKDGAVFEEIAILYKLQTLKRANAAAGHMAVGFSSAYDPLPYCVNSMYVPTEKGISPRQ